MTPTENMSFGPTLIWFFVYFTGIKLFDIDFQNSCMFPKSKVIYFMFLRFKFRFDPNELIFNVIL